MGVNSDTFGEICDNVGLYQLAEELLLLGYVVCPRLQGEKVRKEILGGYTITSPEGR